MFSGAKGLNQGLNVDRLGYRDASVIMKLENGDGNLVGTDLTSEDLSARSSVLQL